MNGTSTLIKVYGPLHPLYLFYLLGYFTAMVTVIVRARIKKTIDTAIHAVILTIAVFVNIGVWLIEQLTRIDFEMLSVSYIISELFLLGVHMVINENQRLRETVRQVERARAVSEVGATAADTMLTRPIEADAPDAERMDVFANGLELLTVTERAIYEAHIARVTSKEIMANLSITENTLKYHNKNIYSKLGISSKKELLEIYKQIKNLSGL